MSDPLKKYNALKKQVELLQRKADKAEGAWNQLRKRLRSEYGCKSLKEAKQKMRDLETELGQLTRQFDMALEEFEKKYGDLL